MDITTLTREECLAILRDAAMNPPVPVVRSKPESFCDCGSPWCADTSHRA